MSDKTEKPTPKKLGEARARGEIPRSQEFNAAIAILFGSLLIKSMGARLVTELKNILLGSISNLPTGTALPVNASLPGGAAAIPAQGLTEGWLKNLAFTDVSRLLAPVGMILVGLMFLGVTVTMVQTKFLWSPNKLKPDLSRLNPLSGFKRLFSTQGLVQLARALLKLTLVVWVSYSFLNSRAKELLQVGQGSIIPSLDRWIDLASALAIQIGEAYLILAIIDYVYQRWNFMRAMRMTKEEIKEEHRRSEGDPFMKARIRGKQRQMARMRMMSNVHKASVVITNPTHLAIAIEYRPGQMSAPRVVAKGAYLIAERIVALARASGIPVVQNIPVARALYRSVRIDQEIPPDLYTALAEILAYVYRLEGHTTFKAAEA